MRSHAALPSFSLRTKLVLSYLAVALGAILILSIVVTQVVQYNFAHQQQISFVDDEANRAVQIGEAYNQDNGVWQNVATSLGFGGNLDPNANPNTSPGFHSDFHSDTFELVTDTSGAPQLRSQYSPISSLSSEQASTVNQCLEQALQGQSPQGSLQQVLMDSGPS